MTGYWGQGLRSETEPRIDGTQATTGGSGTVDEVSALIQGTNPARIADAGHKYREIAELCRESVETLRREAGRIAQTLGGEYLEQAFEKIGELQRDLARISFAADGLSRPLIWYGEQVLPWFQGNVPRTGGVDLDDWIGDNIGQTDTNAHALARHHLQQLNRFIVDVYHAVPDYLEQRATAPQAGMTNVPLPQPSLPGLSSGGPAGALTGNPYAGAGLESPYGQTPGLSGGPTPSTPDIPGLQNPSPQDPSLQNPATPGPSPETPGTTQDPSLQTPQNPSPGAPVPNTPNLSQTPSTTTLSSAPQLTPYNIPVTNVPTPPATSGGPGISPGSAQVTPFTGNPPGVANTSGMGTAGTPMGMYPPGTGPAGQDRERERVPLPLVEHDAFAGDDLGGESVIA
ncbi:hypothetical protein ACWDA3_13810 [Nonomuraea rubra]